MRKTQIKVNVDFSEGSSRGLLNDGFREAEWKSLSRQRDKVEMKIR